eukprot:scaffold220708_cov21-Tisochrysis_lutea.AAC.1
MLPYVQPSSKIDGKLTCVSHLSPRSLLSSLTAVGRPPTTATNYTCWRRQLGSLCLRKVHGPPTTTYCVCLCTSTPTRPCTTWPTHRPARRCVDCKLCSQLFQGSDSVTTHVPAVLKCGQTRQACHFAVKPKHCGQPTDRQEGALAANHGWGFAGTGCAVS